MNGRTFGEMPNFSHFDPDPEGWEGFRRAIKAGKQPVMGTANYHLRLPNETKITEFKIDSKEISVGLSDGRTVRVPLSWFPILCDASEEERQSFELGRGGKVVWFNSLNTEILVDYLLTLKAPYDEVAFLSTCASSDNLLNDSATLIWLYAKEHGAKLDVVLAELREKMAGYPPLIPARPPGSASDSAKRSVVPAKRARRNGAG